MVRSALLALALCSSISVAQERPPINLMFANLEMKASEIASNCFLSSYGLKLDSDAWWKNSNEARYAVANSNLCEAAANTVGVALKDSVKLMKDGFPESEWMNCFEQEVLHLNEDPIGYMRLSFASSPIVKEGRVVVISELAYFEMKRRASDACASKKN